MPLPKECATCGTDLTDKRRCGRLDIVFADLEQQRLGPPTFCNEGCLNQAIAELDAFAEHANPK